jgi:hypothetical protein
MKKVEEKVLLKQIIVDDLKKKARIIRFAKRFDFWRSVCVMCMLYQNKLIRKFVSWSDAQANKAHKRMWDETMFLYPEVKEGEWRFRIDRPSMLTPFYMVFVLEQLKAPVPATFTPFAGLDEIITGKKKEKKIKKFPNKKKAVNGKIFKPIKK